MIDRQPIREFLIRGDPKGVAIAMGAVAAFLAALLGLSIALIGPVYTLIVLLALVASLWAIAGLENALHSTILIVLLLPYGTLPFKVVLTPSFLDLALVSVYFLYLMQWMSGERRRLVTTPVHPLIVLFMLLSLFSFVAGLRYAGLTSNRMRQIVELMLAMGLVFILVDALRTTEQVERFARTAIAAGTVAAIIGIMLWVLPAQTTEGILVRLAPIGYPDSGVINYIEDNPDLPERATSTSVDPNSFGGVLVIVASLTASLLIARENGVAPRWVLAGAFAIMAICLILTFSRGAMLALAAAVLFIGLFGDRRILWVLAGGALLVLIAPITQGYVERFVAGFQGADLATQMRFGEYKDALTLIGRYPLFGVGFTGTPDIDIYLGVANLYLTIASNMGLLGLAVFIVLVLATFAYAWQVRGLLTPRSRQQTLWLGIVAGLVTILVSGVFDHYFFNLEFLHASIIFWTFVGLALATTRMALVESAGVTEARRAT